MRVFYELEHLPSFKNAVITIGTFDGVHRGHQKIIKQLKEEADVVNGESIIITFDPHPRKIVQQEPLFLLNTLSEKLHLLEECGMDNVIVVPFDKKFSSQTAEEYVKDFLVEKIHPHIIIIGYDHRFGKGRTGDYHTLEKYGAQLGFTVKEISEEVLNEISISSTRIRNALLSGDIKSANEFLGYSYFLEGEVVEGKKIGRTIGYPTANIFVDDPDKLIPAIGVYAVKVQIENRTYNGMLGISLRPTIEESTKVSVEVNIFHFHENIYGKIIRIKFIAWLRAEEKFTNLEYLQHALSQDAINAKKILYDLD
ncbi:MAG: bifunctional riboflavin kinase/FAD synthetase [Arachidicoccus sp.]|nr:bifunctional riboflavin kinase/FAD synthetase [Arachidicoccus sp.]